MTGPEPEGVAIMRALFVCSLIGLAMWSAFGGSLWAWEVLPCAR
jgi:hypothetical protein